MVKFICMNKYFQHFSTILCGQVLLYISTMKYLIIVMSFEEISPNLDNLVKVSVTSGNAFHVSCFVDSPCPRNCDTVSHPINAYQKITVLQTFST